ncbi:dna replication protein [Moniliophthora roreri]|uniref:Zinc finger Mcm10/DnaG-type domain-containing protein n=1 Tax=Moniliophthora roreri TaxID=221103 RepID=A0A0W0FZG8_MONRR|nr:dna replication protein [Moniliophthora roreri]
MESSLQKSAKEKQKREEIKREIAKLQSQLGNFSGEETTPGSPKREQRDSVILAPATPSPKKKRKAEGIRQPERKTFESHKTTSAPVIVKVNHIPVKPAASNLLERLTSLRGQPKDEATSDCKRTSAFTDRPHQPDLSQLPTASSSSSGPRRDECLALIEDLEAGPLEHTPPFDDPNFDTIEPNSGIRLSSRTLPHEDLQDYLRGRYYLSPSRLYSSIRLLPDKQGYDVPVPGDWVTIAVVAERGPLKYASAPVGIRKDEDEEENKGKNGKQDKGKEKEKEEHKSKGKKYINFKLIDFGSRSGGSSSGGKAVIRGDAFLSLLLFESDGYDLITREGSKRPEKIYKGGSRGAFEAMTKLKEGDVVALLNPRVLKPYQRKVDDPHPVNNILAITPESAASITTIGRAKDLGMCIAIKRDGKICGSWCDKRVSNVCDFHVQTAVDSRRAARPEFSAGTSGLGSAVARAKRKNDYDSKRQWGLQPNSQQDQLGEAGATYVFSGHIIKGSPNDPECFSREKLTRDQKKLAARESERALEKLLKRDKDGMQSVMKARQALGVTNKRKREETECKKGGTKLFDTSLDDGSELGSDQEPTCKKRRSAYSFQLMRHTGFDPVATKHGEPRQTTEDVKKKMDELALIHQSRKASDLSRIVGPKKRSGVIAPSCPTEPETEELGDGMIDLDAD